MDKLLTLYKTKNSYKFVVPKGTEGRDLEIGLAMVVKNIVDREKLNNPTFSDKNLLEIIGRWTECLREEK